MEADRKRKSHVKQKNEIHFRVKKGKKTESSWNATTTTQKNWIQMCLQFSFIYICVIHFIWVFKHNELYQFVQLVHTSYEGVLNKTVFVIL